MTFGDVGAKKAKMPSLVTATNLILVMIQRLSPFSKQSS